MTAVDAADLGGARTSARAIWIGALATSVFVVTGAAVAAASIPDLPTPENVVRGYVQARFTHDFETLWNLSCRSTQARSHNYATFVRGLRFIAEKDIPMDVDVSIGDIDEAAEVGLGQRAVAVPVTITDHDPGPEAWKFEQEVLLVHEDGEFRVCR